MRTWFTAPMGHEGAPARPSERVSPSGRLPG